MRFLLLISLVFTVSSCGLVDAILLEELGDSSVYELQLDYQKDHQVFMDVTKVEGTVTNTSNDTICNIELKVIITRNDEVVRKNILYVRDLHPHASCRFKEKIDTSAEEDLTVELKSSRYR